MVLIEKGRSPLSLMSIHRHSLVTTIHIWLPTIVMRDMATLTNRTYKWIWFSQMDHSLITNGFWIIPLVTSITTFIQISTIVGILSNTEKDNHIDRMYLK